MGVVLKMAAAGDEQINPDSPPITFESVWKIYPRKVAKKDAEKAWSKVKPEYRQAIFDAVTRARQTDQWRRDGGMFVPYLATYLRGERWNDEIESEATMGQCCWNQNGTREPGRPRCTSPASKEKNGVIYCNAHAGMVN